MKILDAKFVACYLELFLGSRSNEVTEKIKSVSDLFAESECVTNIR